MQNSEVETRKKWILTLRKAKQNARVKKCAHCGKDLNKPCRSHTVPRFILKNIFSQVGEFNYSLNVFGSKYEKDKLGMSEAGCFYLLCNECDKRVFDNYEDENKLLDFNDSRGILCSIALKSSYKKLYDLIYYISLLSDVVNEKKICERRKRFLEDLISYYYSQGEKYNAEINRIKDMIDNENNDKYIIIYKNVLDYVVPIAIQSSIEIEHNIDGKKIKLSREKIEAVQFAIFPLKNQSIIIVFVHESDNSYTEFIAQFNELSESEKLVYINYAIFNYSDEYLLSLDIPKEVFNDEFIKLCKPPTFENLTEEYKFESIERISEKYPNFLLNNKY